MAKLLKVLSVIRSQEWWEYKLPPLLAIGYATALHSNKPFYKVAPWLLFLLFAVMIGAIYVSVVNDITDFEEDVISGKRNRIAGIPQRWRWLIPAGCIITGLFCLYCLSGDRLSMVLYLLPWISFSLYSFEPVRLKKRGIWGILADACGSHVFISLLFVSSTSYFTSQKIDWVWFAATGIWAFAYGLRGILWHQFLDRENDRKIQLNTFASKIEPASFKSKAIGLFAVEITSLFFMLVSISQPLPIAFLCFYLFLMMVRYKKFGYKVIVIMTPPNQPFEIVMMDYYQVFLPLALLLTVAIIQPVTWIVLIIHLMLFPQKLQYAIKDMLSFLPG